MRTLIFCLTVAAAWPGPAAAQSPDERRPLFGEALWLTVASALPLAIGGELAVHPADTFGGAPVAGASLGLGGLGAAAAMLALALDVGFPRRGGVRQSIEALLLAATGLEVLGTLLPLTFAAMQPGPPSSDGSEVLGPASVLFLDSAAGVAAIAGVALALGGALDVTPAPMLGPNVVGAVSVRSGTS